MFLRPPIGDQQDIRVSQDAAVVHDAGIRDTDISTLSITSY